MLLLLRCRLLVRVVTFTSSVPIRQPHLRPWAPLLQTKKAGVLLGGSKTQFHLLKCGITENKGGSVERLDLHVSFFILFKCFCCCFCCGPFFKSLYKTCYSIASVFCAGSSLQSVDSLLPHTWASLLLWRLGSVVVKLGLSSCGSWAYLPRGMQDLSSLIRDQTHVLCTGRWILYDWTTREDAAHFF